MFNVHWFDYMPFGIICLREFEHEARCNFYFHRVLNVWVLVRLYAWLTEHSNIIISQVIVVVNEFEIRLSDDLSDDLFRAWFLSIQCPWFWIWAVHGYPDRITSKLKIKFRFSLHLEREKEKMITKSEHIDWLHNVFMWKLIKDAIGTHSTYEKHS